MKRNYCLFIIFSLFVFSGCALLTNNDDGMETGKVIPFTFYGDFMPVIKVTDDNKLKSFYFMFDTGCNACQIYDCGIKKIYNSDDFNLKVKIDKKNLRMLRQLPESERKKKIKDIVSRGRIVIKFPVLKCSNIEIQKKDFYYDPQGSEKYTGQIDGMVGIPFFDNPKNIVIDYKKNIIILDAEKICSSGSPMHKIEELNLYSTKISIDGIVQDALIDTGAGSFFVRDEFETAKEYSDEDLYAFLKQKVPVTDAWEKNINICICNKKLVCPAYKITDSRISPYDDKTRSLGSKINILGYPVFKGRVIQFDFEESEFRIK